MPYIKRRLEQVLKKAAREFPVAVLTGPRQSGKTTLLKHIFRETHGYVSLEAPDVRASASADPRGFLDMHPPPVILDEIQEAPSLLPYIKERVDAERGRKGRYLLTGSQNLLLVSRVTESLAGRAAMLRLLPLSNAEKEGHPQARFPWEGHKATPVMKSVSGMELWKNILRGGYPELAAEPRRDSFLWHTSYVQTYLERDVRNLRQVGDLSLFQGFLRILAARSGQLLNMADVGRDLGVALNTVKNWISILEATFQVVILRPYSANIGKRLVKTPKVYFTDTGTLCYLVGLKDPGHASSGPMAGAIFETAVVSEVMKNIVHKGEEPRLYFWRTSSGDEVDLVIEREGKLIPVEVKLTSTPHPNLAAGLNKFRQIFRGKVDKAYLVHPGEVRLPLGFGVTALPLMQLAG